MHAIIMADCFGLRTLTYKGKEHGERRSLGTLTNTEAQQLIEHDLAICADNGIRVPSKEELGYLPR